MSEKDSNIVALDPRHQRALNSLRENPRGLTLRDIAEITGMSDLSCYVALRDLFNAQEVVEVRAKGENLYMLKQKFDIAVAGLEKSKRSISE